MGWRAAFVRVGARQKDLRALAAIAGVMVLMAVGGSFAIHARLGSRHKPATRALAPLVKKDPTLSWEPAAPSPYYRPRAYWEIRTALRGAAAFLRGGRPESAYELLASPILAERTGVIVEHYLAARVEGGAGSLDPAQSAELRRALFDLTYPIGQAHQRGVRIGDVALLDGNTPPSPAALFARSDDFAAYMRMRTLVVMEAWIRVWQDVAGVRPLSETTVEYIAETGERSGWSTVDVLAVWRDLDLPVPSDVIDDPRFPEWRRFEVWRAASAVSESPRAAAPSTPASLLAWGRP